MPNSLVHFGVQGLIGRTLFPQVDVRWILLGCLIPDVPWIVQRIIRTIFPFLDLYDLRLYAIVQASFFECLILCSVCCVLSSAPRQVFFILSLNSIIHLLVDALQIKWANGVHLFAPFSWNLMNVGWFWPESIVTYVLTIFGLGWVVWVMWKVWPTTTLFKKPSPGSLAWAFGLLMVYMISPIYFLQGPWLADNHFVQTIQNIDYREGKPIEFDRISYSKGLDQDQILTWADEAIVVAGLRSPQSGTVSIRGHFENSKTVNIHRIHEHSWWFRDGASLLGLSLFFVIWIIPIFTKSTMLAKK